MPARISSSLVMEESPRFISSSTALLIQPARQSRADAVRQQE